MHPLARSLLRSYAHLLRYTKAHSITLAKVHLLSTHLFDAGALDERELREEWRVAPRHGHRHGAGGGVQGGGHGGAHRGVRAAGGLAGEVHLEGVRVRRRHR
eukprot:1061167-Pyramimonas_sp.AAC.1